MSSIQLPPLPEKAVIAFDESTVIHGYGATHMYEYALAAIKADRENRMGFFARIAKAMQTGGQP